MKTRMFTVNGKTTQYDGFDRDFDPRELEHVVIVQTEGEIDLYAVMYPNRLLGDLFRYLADRGENSTVIGLYTRKDAKVVPYKEPYRYLGLNEKFAAGDEAIERGGTTWFQIVDSLDHSLSEMKNWVCARRPV